jgi:hypothetical protein
MTEINQGQLKNGNGGAFDCLALVAVRGLVKKTTKGCPSPTKHPHPSHAAHTLFNLRQGSQRSHIPRENEDAVYGVRTVPLQRKPTKKETRRQPAKVQKRRKRQALSERRQEDRQKRQRKKETAMHGAAQTAASAATVVATVAAAAALAQAASAESTSTKAALERAIFAARVAAKMASFSLMVAGSAAQQGGCHSILVISI